MKELLASVVAVSLFCGCEPEVRPTYKNHGRVGRVDVREFEHDGTTYMIFDGFEGVQVVIKPEVKPEKEFHE